MKKIVIACDSYKGCLSSSEVARAAAEGVAEAVSYTHLRAHET